MGRLLITDPADPRIVSYRSVHEPELARAGGLFVAEGRLVVQRAIEAGHGVRSVLVNEAAAAAMASTLDLLEAPVYVCDAATIEHVSGHHIHRGCVALVERPAPRTPAAVAGAARTIVALEDVTNADNIGGVFRNAAAFGAAVLLSPRCCDPLYRKAIRTSMGAVLSVPWATVEDWPAGLFALRDHGFTVVALSPRQPSAAIDDFHRETLRGPLVLVAGTEGAGLSLALQDGADYRVRIPISSAVDSLNLAVAVGIGLARLIEESKDLKI
ncbi:MAG TPA: RNA methyltransferase [Vicinamibacterales bacterium]|jgi:tRNA G18 (ribose-2'-O)-methylase SpoU|nr:RNA methyltransferase [Vicinamibacterales bacterium]